jgi:hypothetical protein
MQTAEAALWSYNALEGITNDLNFKLKPRGKQSKKKNNKEDKKMERNDNKESGS